MACSVCVGRGCPIFCSTCLHQLTTNNPSEELRAAMSTALITACPHAWLVGTGPWLWHIGYWGHTGAPEGSRNQLGASA